MPLYKWSNKALIPQLSEKFIKRSTETKIMSERKSVVIKKEIPQKIKNHIWNKIGKYEAPLREQMGKVLAYLTFRLSRDVLELRPSGEVILQGTVVPGTNILRIIESMIKKSNTYESGEMLILSMLLYSPPRIRNLFQKKKLQFIKDEEKEEGMQLITRDFSDKKDIHQETRKNKKILKTKFDPNTSRNYPRKYANKTGRIIGHSVIPHMKKDKERLWYDLTSANPQKKKRKQTEEEKKE